ncbi:MAG TPA: hypothetical protein VGS97_00580 [Actinocrinis sp.]|uniref:hypothetical protein n=1 Tax=Actinocrinis sp. TaxID=1920516 RepID=UPI002DDCA0DA|nr:hypothetical protein [Actinocrinis sp.]HEV2342559.1 hypothetical protein [Actinocrinis sp.]
MVSASFGREIADSHFQHLFEQAEHDRLVGCLKQRRRARASATRREAAARRKVAGPCPQDLG